MTQHHRHILYRMFNKSDELLYVGLTNDPKGRTKSHGKQRPWFDEVDHITVTTYPSREELAYAEQVAIRTEHPRYNVALRSIPRPVAVERRCPTCKSPNPAKMPLGAEELVLEDGSLIPFCTDPFHFPDCPNAAQVHEHRDLLRRALLLRWSAEGERRIARMRDAMKVLEEAFKPGKDRSA